MDKLRRVGGEMEPHRRPSGRRALLPAEVELCQAIGLSEEEYWYFVDQAEQYNGTREPEYENVPDVRAEATTIIAVASLVIGLASTAISLLMRPKPSSQDDKQLRPRKLGGREEAGNFAQVDGFQSVQELARQGQTIPLVFAKKGVRVNGQLVWSQMIALERSQQLKAMFVFSDGITEEPPDFIGLAIGDTTLATYTAQKVRAHWNHYGGRIKSNMALPGSGLPPQIFSDAYSIWWDGRNDEGTGDGQYRPFFSGATFTTVQSTFGCYGAIPNNTWRRSHPELILKPEDAPDGLNEDAEAREELSNTEFSWRTFFSTVRNPAGGGGLGYQGNVVPSPDPGGAYDQISFRISTGCEERKIDRFKPETLDAINSSTISKRQAADKQIAIGELYLVGDTTLAVCTEKNYTNPQYYWRPDPSQIENLKEAANDVTAWFTITTPGKVNCIDRTGSVIQSENDAVNWEYQKGSRRHAPHHRYALQRAAVATVTNTFPCQATELVIKSNVWKQVSGFPDLQAWPSQKLIKKYEKAGGSLSLGSISKYQKRYSFFMLEVRTVGEAQWTDVTGTSYFMVEGDSPVDQYNYIRVDVGTRGLGNVESEFRLRPVSGIGALEARNAGRSFRRLRVSGTETKYGWNGYTIVYGGDVVYLKDEELENRDFIKRRDYVKVEGAIDNMGITPTEAGTHSEPGPHVWTRSPFSPRYSQYPPRNFLIKRISFTNATDNLWQYWWDDSRRAEGKPTSQSVEPPLAYEGTGIGAINPNIRYSWDLRTPGQENDTVNAYPYFWVYRSIVREDLLPGPSLTEPYAAGTTDAVHVDVAEGAEGLKFYVRVWRNSIGQDIGYKWTVAQGEQGKGYKPGNRVIVVSPTDQRQIMTVTITGTVEVGESQRDEVNYQKYDPILDVGAFESQSQSNESSPEHELVAINEQRAQFEPTFEGMTTGGIRINSSTEWSNFSSFSAFMKKGIVIENLITGAQEASNLLPDIVFAMMTNNVWGAGTILGPQQVDREAMTEASRFCLANDFTWDGVVNERVNFREWVYQQAQYCLLDATVIGGRFALKPTVPTAANGVIDGQARPDIRALFTDGNMVDMQVTFLTPEERQLFRAEVLWREDTVNGFPKTRVYTRQYSPAYGGSAADPIETFDLSGFCTTENHARRFAQFALAVRKHVDHAITFKTTPQAAMGLIPGEYFKVNSASSHTSRFNNGSINNEGFITTNETLSDGAYQVYYWHAGTEGIREGTINVTDGRCTDVGFHNTVFTLRQTTTESRVYKLESLTYAEDGLVEVAGTHMPLTDIGSLAITDWNPAYYIS